ncbi:hypothetical protein HER39_19790, partial [Arthrobacter deserti]|nr:hypothetical protein [Arthrobacter deserti]
MDGRNNSRLREAAMRNPLRSSGGMHEAGRFRRGIAEFLRLPLLIIFAFCSAGVIVSVLDAAGGGQAPLRSVAAAMVPGEGSVDFV